MTGRSSSPWGRPGIVDELNRTVRDLTDQLERLRVEKKRLKKDNLEAMMENVQNVRVELNKVRAQWGGIQVDSVPIIIEGHDDMEAGGAVESGDAKDHILHKVEVMATDDSMSDDVFESEECLRAPMQQTTPSPTGYRGYQPPAELFKPEPEPELPHKTILLGDSGVGKTSLLVQFDTGKFQTGTFSATVGIGFTNKVVSVDDAKVKLQIWDTAGQERFRSVTHAYYRDAHALLLLYDVTNKTSFDNIRAWLGEIREYAQDDVVIMLLGNKADCQASERMIRREDGERLAKEYNVTFMETSAKTGLNVELAFMAIARELKSRKCGNPDDTVFNVQEYVREQTQRGTCPPCST